MMARGGPPSGPGTSITLLLFKSRWTTPTWWAASSAAAICLMIGSASSVVRRCPCRRSASVGPLSSCIVTNVMPGGGAAADPSAGGAR